MRYTDHEKAIRELTAKHWQTVQGLQTQIQQLKANQVACMPVETAHKLAHMAVQSGLAAHAVYKLGETVMFLLFQDHDSFHLWVRAQSAGRTVGAFHGGDIR